MSLMEEGWRIRRTARRYTVNFTHSRSAWAAIDEYNIDANSE